MATDLDQHPFSWIRKSSFPVYKKYQFVWIPLQSIHIIIRFADGCFAKVRRILQLFQLPCIIGMYGLINTIIKIQVLHNINFTPSGIGPVFSSSG